MSASKNQHAQPQDTILYYQFSIFKWNIRSYFINPSPFSQNPNFRKAYMHNTLLINWCKIKRIKSPYFTLSTLIEPLIGTSLERVSWRRKFSLHFSFFHFCLFIKILDSSLYPSLTKMTSFEIIVFRIQYTYELTIWTINLDKNWMFPCWPKPC